MTSPKPVNGNPALAGFGALVDECAQRLMMLGALGLICGLMAWATGCVGQRGLLAQGVVKMYEADTVVMYFDTQDQVTRTCAKTAGKSDTGLYWDKNGNLPDGSYIAACTNWDPKRKQYPFHIYLWKEESWRRSHEECHVALFRAYGFKGDHSKCADYGYNKAKKRL